MKKSICENCGNEHDGSYGSGRFCSDHCRRSFNGKKRKPENYPTVDELKKRGFFDKNINKHIQSGKKWKCPYCKDNLIFESRLQLYKHMHKAHTDRFGHIWNKGLTKEIDNRLKKAGNTYSTKIKAGLIIPPMLGRHHTKAVKQYLSKVTGGFREGGGRGKHGRYHGIWCDSSWELAWIIYQEDHGVQFKRYKGYFEYEFEGKKRKYYPDFQLEDGTIIEIKGYESKLWQAKLRQLPKTVKIQILREKEMTPILDYVKFKYGKNFISLYET